MTALLTALLLGQLSAGQPAVLGGNQRAVFYVTAGAPGTVYSGSVPSSVGQPMTVTRTTASAYENPQGTWTALSAGQIAVDYTVGFSVDANPNTYLFPNSDAPVTATVTLANNSSYTLSTPCASAGSVTITKGTATYTAGVPNSCTVTSTAASGDCHLSTTALGGGTATVTVTSAPTCVDLVNQRRRTVHVVTGASPVTKNSTALSVSGQYGVAGCMLFVWAPNWTGVVPNTDGTSGTDTEVSPGRFSSTQKTLLMTDGFQILTSGDQATTNSAQINPSVFTIDTFQADSIAWNKASNMKLTDYTNSKSATSTAFSPWTPVIGNTALTLAGPLLHVKTWALVLDPAWCTCKVFRC